MTDKFDIDKASIRIDAGILSLQSKLGLPIDFFKNLLNENDWSCVIKLHALIEGVCSNLLVFHFNDPNLERIFSRLDMSDTKTGKLAFLLEAKLVTKIQSKYITSLSQFRNKLVHNVSNYNVDLKEMIKNFDDNQVKSLAIAFSPFESQVREFNNLDIPVQRPKLTKELEKQINIENIIVRFNNNPKLHIWTGAYSILSSLAEKYYSDFEQWEKVKKIMDNEREIL